MKKKYKTWLMYEMRIIYFPGPEARLRERLTATLLNRDSSHA